MNRESSTLFGGFDFHKDGIDIAVANAESYQVGTIKGDPASLERAPRKLVSCGQPSASA